MVVKAIINHPPNHHFYGWYKWSKPIVVLTCFNHIKLTMMRWKQWRVSDLFFFHPTSRWIDPTIGHECLRWCSPTVSSPSYFLWYIPKVCLFIGDVLYYEISISPSPNVCLFTCFAIFCHSTWAMLVECNLVLVSRRHGQYASSTRLARSYSQ